MSHTVQTQQTSHDTILEIRDVSVSFAMDRGKSTVLDSASINVERESIVGIVGESGSGKSMFASALLDSVEEPGVVNGEIMYYPEEDDDPINVLNLDDEELRQFRWEEIAMVFQGAQDSFNPTMSIEGHFKETLRAHEYDVEAGMEYGRQLLKGVFLDPDRVLKSYPHELSGGMQQRALIALSLVLEPNVLVMDEPTGALDLLMQRSITSMMAHLQETLDLTILFITHDLPLVTNFADLIAVMYAFHFVEIGPTKDVLMNSTHPYTRALLKAVPNVSSPLDEMRPIEGDAPDPVNVPEGCSYHPRCPISTEECIHQEPAFQEVADDHEVACYHWEKSKEAIQYTLSQEGNR